MPVSQAAGRGVFPLKTATTMCGSCIFIPKTGIYQLTKGEMLLKYQQRFNI